MRIMSHSLTGVSTTAAAVIGAVPVPFADALILAPLEIGMINALARIYGINKTDGSKMFIDSIVKTGTVGIVAKTAISSIKTIPSVNIAASVLNAIVAGTIVAALGQGSIYAFEQIHQGKKTVQDIDWVEKILEAQILEKLPGLVKFISENITQASDMKAIVEIISDTFLGEGAK